jgi:hypothetical protein
VRLGSYCLGLPDFLNTSQPTELLDTSDATPTAKRAWARIPMLRHQQNLRSGSAWRKGPAGRLVCEIHASKRLFLAYSANGIRPYTTVVRRSPSTLFPFRPFERWTIPFTYYHGTDALRLPWFFSSRRIVSHAFPANRLLQDYNHVISMSNHPACTYPGAASRAGFPLDPMGHLCGPPCLSPRLLIA